MSTMSWATWGSQNQMEPRNSEADRLSVVSELVQLLILQMRELKAQRNKAIFP